VERPTLTERLFRANLIAHLDSTKGLGVPLYSLPPVTKERKIDTLTTGSVMPMYPCSHNCPKCSTTTVNAPAAKRSRARKKSNAD